MILITILSIAAMLGTGIGFVIVIFQLEEAEKSLAQLTTRVADVRQAVAVSEMTTKLIDERVVGHIKKTNSLGRTIDGIAATIKRWDDVIKDPPEPAEAPPADKPLSEADREMEMVAKAFRDAREEDVHWPPSLAAFLAKGCEALESTEMVRKAPIVAPDHNNRTGLGGHAFPKARQGPSQMSALAARQDLEAKEKDRKRKIDAWWAGMRTYPCRNGTTTPNR